MALYRIMKFICDASVVFLSTTSCHISNRLQLRSRYISVILMKDVSWISSLYSSLYLFNERSRIIYNELWDLGFEMQKFEKCWILNQNCIEISSFEFWKMNDELVIWWIKIIINRIFLELCDLQSWKYVYLYR